MFSCPHINPWVQRPRSPHCSIADPSSASVTPSAFLIYQVARRTRTRKRTPRALPQYSLGLAPKLLRATLARANNQNSDRRSHDGEVLEPRHRWPTNRAVTAERPIHAILYLSKCGSPFREQRGGKRPGGTLENVYTFYTKLCIDWNIFLLRSFGDGVEGCFIGIVSEISDICAVRFSAILAWVRAKITVRYTRASQWTELGQTRAPQLGFWATVSLTDESGRYGWTTDSRAPRSEQRRGSRCGEERAWGAWGGERIAGNLDNVYTFYTK